LKYNIAKFRCAQKFEKLLLLDHRHHDSISDRLMTSHFAWLRRRPIAASLVSNPTSSIETSSTQTRHWRHLGSLRWTHPPGPARDRWGSGWRAAAPDDHLLGFLRLRGFAHPATGGLTVICWCGEGEQLRDVQRHLLQHGVPPHRVEGIDEVQFNLYLVWTRLREVWVSCVSNCLGTFL